MDTRLGSHHLGAHGWLRLLVAAALVLIFILTLEAGPAAGATSRACRVTNASTGQTYNRLQQAVDAAQRGDTLLLLGACRGATIIDRDLAIMTAPAASNERAVLKVEKRERTLSVLEGVTLTLTNVVIRGAPIWTSAGLRNNGVVLLEDVVVRDGFSGIVNFGDLTMDGTSTVRRNRGGGVYNAGTLTLNHESRISTNEATEGGGVYNEGTLTLNHQSRISGNRVRMSEPGSGGVYNTGVLTLNDLSRISRNRGGGVHNAESGTVTLNDRSAIIGNEAIGWAGGVFNEGTVALTDSSTISRNDGKGIGGGVVNYGTLTLADSSSIRDNWTKPDTGTGTICGMAGDAIGGGVFNRGRLVLWGGSTISGNTSGWGAGVENRGEVTLADTSSIRDNHAVHIGGGVLNDPGSLRCPRGSLSMRDASVISANRADESAGGVFTGGDLMGVTCGPDGNVHGNTPDDCAFE